MCENYRMKNDEVSCINNPFDDGRARVKEGRMQMEMRFDLKMVNMLVDKVVKEMNEKQLEKGQLLYTDDVALIVESKEDSNYWWVNQIESVVM